MKIEKVFIDLDGVLADFESKAKCVMRYYGNEINDDMRCFNVFKKSKVWGLINKYNNEVEPFFETLTRMGDGLELFEFVTSNFNNVEILTATGFTPRDAGDQKMRWFPKNYSGDVIVNTVERSSYKSRLASPARILIDDSPRSIDPWVEVGGIGILHTDTSSTIEKLRGFM